MQNPSRVLVSRFAMEVATSLFTMAIGAITLFGSLEFGIGWGDAGPQPGYFPFYVGLIIIIASAAALFQGFICQRSRKEAFLTVEQGVRILSFFGPMLGFVLISSFLGIYVGLCIYLTGVMTVQGGYRPLKAFVFSIGMGVAFYLIFDFWFQVPLLKGPLEALLGIH